MSTLHLAEVFGPTFQGEGPGLGRRCGFVRLAGCNLTCGACDTGYAWDGKRYNLAETTTTATVSQVLESLAAMGGMTPLDLVVITGGEPLLHQRQEPLRTLVEALTIAGIRVQFETNGTISPAAWLDRLGDLVTYVVSPKVTGPLATDPESRRIRPDVIADYVRRATPFKIVAATVDDIRAISAFADTHGIPRNKIWIMPEGVTPQSITSTAQALANIVLANGFHMTTRLHTLLWPGETKGR